MNRFKEYKSNPWKLFYLFNRWHILEMLPDKLYLKLKWRIEMGYPLNLKKPKTFNEKLQWLKLYNSLVNYTSLVDKYEVKHIVSSLIGEDYIIPCLGVWNNFDEINFDKLPNQFVLKCTHDSGGLIIVKDKAKFDKAEAKRRINQSLSRNYYILGRETPYKNVKPRIIAEKYMADESGTELKDYKIFCFNGVPKFIQVDFGRFTNHRRNIYDTDWNRMDIQLLYPTDENIVINKPQHLTEMLHIASLLAQGKIFVRIDLYSILDKIYFGEFTFFPGAGYEAFYPQKWNYIMGDLIQLPDKTK